MRISVADRLEITDLRPTSKGYLAVRANIARSGVYKYARREIGLKDGDPNELVGVYRSPDFVFNADSLATIAHKPVTINHPASGVSDENWKENSVGHIGGAVWEAEDRRHVQVDMLLMDKAAINAAKTTHKELSLGYTVDIRPVDNGISPEGEPYAAEMFGVYEADHLALVPAGRAGSTCRVGDAAWPVEVKDSNTPPKPKKERKQMATLMLDGLKVDLEDAEAVSAAFKKLTDKAESALADKVTAETSLADAQASHATAATAHVTAVQAKDAEIATLTATVATLNTQLADAQSPERLKEAAAAYTKVVDAANKLGVTVTDGMKDADIRKAAVNAKLGDVAKDWTDAQIAVSFDTLAAGVKDAPVLDAFQKARMGMKPIDMADAATTSRNARLEMIAGFAREDAE